MNICAESSTDAIAKLRAEGMGLNAACKLVANEYNRNKPKDSERAHWKTLKQRYVRANQVEDTKAAQGKPSLPKKKVSGPTKKELLDKLRAQESQIVELSQLLKQLNEENQVVSSPSAGEKNLEKELQDLKEQRVQEIAAAAKSISGYEREQDRLNVIIAKQQDDIHSLRALLDELHEEIEQLKKENLRSQEIRVVYDKIVEGLLNNYPAAERKRYEIRIQELFSEVMQKQF
jgi:DNA repair exonuclease SbcCD ATPase subunit